MTIDDIERRLTAREEYANVNLQACFAGCAEGPVWVEIFRSQFFTQAPDELFDLELAQPAATFPTLHCHPSD